MTAHRPARALVALALPLCIVWVLHTCGGLTIPLGSPAELARWAESSPPPTMAAAVLRLGAMGVAAYTAGVVSLVLIADVVRCRGLAQAALVASPAALRRALGGGAAQAALVAGTVVATAPVVSAQEPAQPTATMALVEPEPVAVASMVWLGPDDAAPRPPPPSSTPTPSAPPGDEVWLVEPGDSFWSIAEATLGDPPAGTDISAYWQQLITANRDRLVSPDCPDLLIPGQTLVLPTP